VIAATEREAAAALTRWLNWQGRYQRSSRRSELQARVVAVAVFAAIIANLLVQLFARHA